MDTVVIPKAWWTSKAIQGAVVGFAASVYRVLARRFHWPEWNNDDADLVVQLLQFGGFAWAAIGLRTASQPIGNPSTPVVTTTTPVGTASGEVPSGTPPTQQP